MPPAVRPAARHDPFGGAVTLAGAVALLVALTGCGGGEDAAPVEFDLIPERPPMAEVEFGHFVVPVPGYAEGEADPRNYLQLEFVLVGVVEPADASETERLAERRRGELRDRVIRVCRNTSLSELQAPDLVTLKLRLIDATQPVFEGISFDTLLLHSYAINAL